MGAQAIQSKTFVTALDRAVSILDRALSIDTGSIFCEKLPTRIHPRLVHHTQIANIQGLVVNDKMLTQNNAQIDGKKTITK